jgi:hypothetical protein
MSNFSALSRYAGIEQTPFELADGRMVAYVRRRFLPDPSRFALLQTYQVVQGDRIDNVATLFLGDPEQFWRLADANRAMQPERLLETPGRTLRITLPEGIPGAFGA